MAFIGEIYVNSYTWFDGSHWVSDGIGFHPFHTGDTSCDIPVQRQRISLVQAINLVLQAEQSCVIPGCDAPVTEAHQVLDACYHSQLGTIVQEVLVGLRTTLERLFPQRYEVFLTESA